MKKGDYDEDDGAREIKIDCNVNNKEVKDNIYSMILEIVDHDCTLTDAPSNDFVPAQ